MRVQKDNEQAQKEIISISVKDKGLVFLLGAKAIKWKATIQLEKEAFENGSFDKNEEENDDQSGEEEDDGEKVLEQTKTKKPIELEK